MKTVLVFLAALLFGAGALASEFDHNHSTYAQVLEDHVAWTKDRTASVVDYRALVASPGKLDTYLSALSTVPPSQFQSWTESQQLAFLINAYNAFTLKLIIDHYPVDSIKDIGGFFSSPWDKAFFSLLGQEMTLDELEHGIIRENYAEPRIHFAVNCASIGCPALRDEPFLPKRLDAQLEDSTERFLGDASRNRLEEDELHVSPIFKWYREDFATGWRGAESLAEFLALYANSLELSEAQQDALVSGEIHIDFTDYDWSLNKP